MLNILFMCSCLSVSSLSLPVFKLVICIGAAELCVSCVVLYVFCILEMYQLYDLQILHSIFGLSFYFIDSSL